MARVHLLTVGEGDCTVIQHNSGRVTVIDICGGNRAIEKAGARIIEAIEKPKGNFAMCKCPTNPIEYLTTLGVQSIWRFISSHPDMDHLDGFNRLANNFPINNFWYTGANKNKPDFEGTRYNEDDWNRYERYRTGKESNVTVLEKVAGSKFAYANAEQAEGGGHDGLHIAAPSSDLVSQANQSQEFNDASFIISYHSSAGKLIFPGDAHDGAWECAIEQYPSLVKDATFLLAPHHGRKSSRDYSYLDSLKPTVSLLGCAPSEYTAYGAWANRDLKYFTQNQAGNVVLEIEGSEIDVYVQNGSFAEKAGGDVCKTNDQGYYFLASIS